VIGAGGEDDLVGVREVPEGEGDRLVRGAERALTDVALAERDAARRLVHDDGDGHGGSGGDDSEGGFGRVAYAPSLPPPEPGMTASLLLLLVAAAGSTGRPAPAPAAAPAANARVDVATLLQEMTDLDRLTRPAAYRTIQFSSYDRASHRADDPEAWFANGDRGHYLRVEDGRFVLAEVEGPG